MLVKGNFVFLCSLRHPFIRKKKGEIFEGIPINFQILP